MLSSLPFKNIYLFIYLLHTHFGEEIRLETLSNRNQVGIRKWHSSILEKLRHIHVFGHILHSCTDRMDLVWVRS